MCVRQRCLIETEDGLKQYTRIGGKQKGRDVQPALAGYGNFSKLIS
jgi:hypothetical protein